MCFPHIRVRVNPKNKLWVSFFCVFAVEWSTSDSFKRILGSAQVTETKNPSFCIQGLTAVRHFKKIYFVTFSFCLEDGPLVMITWFTVTLPNAGSTLFCQSECLQCERMGAASVLYPSQRCPLQWVDQTAHFDVLYYLRTLISHLLSSLSCVMKWNELTPRLVWNKWNPLSSGLWINELNKTWRTKAVRGSQWALYQCCCEERRAHSSSFLFILFSEIE